MLVYTLWENTKRLLWGCSFLVCEYRTHPLTYYKTQSTPRRDRLYQKMETQQPKITPFTYLLIPADPTQPVRTLTFDGPSDDELRASITEYFRQTKFSVAQREEMKASLVEKAIARGAPPPGTAATAPSSSTAVVAPIVGEDEGSVTAAAPTTASTEPSRIPALAEDFVDHSSFEIVPVVMPMRSTGFVGTSLYIDDAGRFKELPLNPRASTIAQKDIRGDAFLLSNHDDPALDEWKRVDCTEEVLKTLLAHPPASTLDTSDQAAMGRATMVRNLDAQKISKDDVARALQARKDGNALVGQGDMKAAVVAYSEAIDLLQGRRDLHDNAEELEQAMRAAVLNRSFCYGKLGQWSDALKDATLAVEMDPGNSKGFFRLATARAALKEYDDASAALRACVMTGGSTPDTDRLAKEIAEGRAEFKRAQKQQFEKLFQSS